MKEEEISRLITAVELKIEKTVNGKIIKLGEDVAALHSILEKQNESTSAFHDKVNAHMERVEPVIKSYEEDQVISGRVGVVGEKVVFWGKVVTAIGVVVLGIKYGITRLW